MRDLTAKIYDIANSNEEHLANYTGNLKLINELLSIIEAQGAALIEIETSDYGAEQWKIAKQSRVNTLTFLEELAGVKNEK